MLYNNRQTNFIGHNFVGIYKTTPIGNLDKIRFVEDMTFPLQQAFQCNISTCISIGVHYNSAFLASEQGIVSTVMSLPNSTAVVAELGCMPTINYVKRNSLIKASGIRISLNFPKGILITILLNFLPFGFESFKVLNGNISIIPQGKVGNLS